jgi:NAD(P)-dependent dehydrogenase (short-subunit alcohol dehydrogenase family)
MKVAIVTGTSSGIGRETVQHLVNAGIHVIATARNTADIADLKSEMVTTARLDMLDEPSMIAVVSETMATFGRIDALVNNAGYGMMLPVEETPLEAMQAQFDVNVFGVHRLTQLVLPHMRAAGHGRIVNVSSIAGHISLPMMGPYCASKFALRALTTALDGEVRPYGIRACLVEPGVIKTSFGKRSEQERTSRTPPDSPYPWLHKKWAGKRAGQNGAHPRVIAKRITHACNARRPKFHYFAPLDAKATNILKRLLPDAALNWIIRRYFGSK